MLQVGMKAENCLLRYRALKSPFDFKLIFLERAFQKKDALASDIRDELDPMDKIRKVKVIDIARHDSAIEKMRSEMNDFYESGREAIKKEMRTFCIGFAVYINGIFVVAAIAESFLEGHGPSPKKRRTDGNPVSVHGTG